MTSRVRVCDPSELVPGMVKVVHLARAADGTPREAIVLRDRAGVARAYLNECKHLPIPLDAGSREFLDSDGVHLICGTHGARYRPEDGLCIDGPCEDESLEPIVIAETGTEITILDARG